MEPGLIVDNKYKIIEKVGKGAFATWYKATQITEEEADVSQSYSVVLKVAHKTDISLLNEWVVNQEACRHNRLLKYREYSSIEVLDDEKTPDNYEYLVSEYMENGDLFKFVNNEGFDEDWARFLFKNVIRALEAFHNNGYAHLDIKLGNILLDSHYFPKLADFGFAQRFPEDDVFASKDFRLIGTKHYICPEMQEEPLFSGQAADIFACGVSFFILMIGDYPFNSATKTDTKYQNLYKKNPLVFWKKHSRAKKRF